MSRAARAFLITAFLFVSGCGPAPEPSFSTDAHTSAAGRIVGRVSSDPAPPPVNVMHTWTLHLETPSGEPIEDAEISVDGDMPAHGHGLPTEPRVTRYLGDGTYLVEGMQFQMGGEWYVEFAIRADGVEDTLRFSFTL